MLDANKIETSNGHNLFWTTCFMKGLKVLYKWSASDLLAEDHNQDSCKGENNIVCGKNLPVPSVPLAIQVHYHCCQLRDEAFT